MKNLEHGIVVGGFFRDILDDVPVFDDFPVFDAEDVDSCLTAVFFVELDVVVDEDQVAVSADVLDDSRAVRIRFQETADAVLKGLFAIGKFRAVCLYLRTDHGVDDGGVVFVEYFVPEIFSYGFIVLEMRRTGCERRTHGQAADEGQGQT